MNKFLVLLLLSSLNFCMEKEAPIEPEATIPASIAYEYNKEKTKFKKYDLDHPEKFIKNFLKPDQTDLRSYAHKLQFIATTLLLDNAAFAAECSMLPLTLLREHINKRIAIKDEQLGLLKEIDPNNPSRSSYSWKAETAAQTNEILSHINLLQSTSKDQATIMQKQNLALVWAMDEKFGLWLNRFGSRLFYSSYLEMYSPEFDKYTEKIEKMPGINVPSAYSSICKSNTPFSSRMEKIETLFALRKHHVTDQLLNKHLLPIIELAYYTYGWSAQLYQIVYDELHATVQKLIRADISDKQLISYLSPNVSDPHGVLPKLLPKKLPALAPHYRKTSDKLINIFEELITRIEKNQHPDTPQLKSQKSKPRCKRRLNQPLFATISPDATQIEPDLPEDGETPQSKILKQSPLDQSYILEDEHASAANITIHNPAHGTTEIIFKTEKPYSIKEKIPATDYTSWVKAWWNNAQQALMDQGYTTAGSKKFTAPHQQWKPIALHGFSPLIDDYIMQWGTMTHVPSRRDAHQQDILITIPGMMRYPDGTEETGVFAYLINTKTGQWYHRMFEPQSGQKLIADLFEKGYFSPEMTGYYEVWFPPLQKL